MLYIFQPAIDWMRHNVKEIVGTVDCNLVFSLLKLLECFFTPFTPKEVRQGMVLVPFMFNNCTKSFVREIFKT